MPEEHVPKPFLAGFTSLLKAVALFALGGPLCIWLVGAGLNVVSTGTLPTIQGMALIAPVFTLGAPPASATGAVAWLIRDRLGVWPGSGVCGLAGAAAGTVPLVIMPHSPLPLSSVVALGSAPGGMAGMICGLFYLLLHRRAGNRLGMPRDGRGRPYNEHRW